MHAEGSVIYGVAVRCCNSSRTTVLLLMLASCALACAKAAIDHCVSTQIDRRGAMQGRNGRSVDLEDIKFHQCVRLTEFDENRQIVFTPPDGEFELMSYRLSQLELTPPFWVDCQVEHHGKSRVEYMVKIRSQFKQKVQAQSVEVMVPCPPDCQNPVTKQSAVRVFSVWFCCPFAHHTQL